MDYIFKSDVADIFPKVMIALRIILSMSVDVTSGGAQFLCIEDHQVVSSLNYVEGKALWFGLSIEQVLSLITRK